MKVLGVSLLVILAHLICQVQSFYFELTANSSKCFQIQRLSTQNILIQGQVSKLGPGMTAKLVIYKKQQQVFSSNLLSNNTFQLSYPQKALSLKGNQQNYQQQVQYSICINLSEAKVEIDNNREFMFSMQILSNFTHVLNQKKNKKNNDAAAFTKINEKILSITSICQQQIDLHRQFEKKQHKTKQDIISLREKIHFYCGIQCLVVLFSSILYVHLIRKYLKDNYLI